MAALGLKVLFSAAPAAATTTYAVMESIPSHGGAIRVSTGAGNHVSFSTSPYTGTVPNVGIYTSSNVVISTRAAGPNIVLYATGSVTALSANFSASGNTTYSLALSSGVNAPNGCIVLKGGTVCGPTTATGIVDGSIDTNKLAVDAVTTNKILFGNVDSTKLAVPAVDSGKIFTASIQGYQIQYGTIDSNKMAVNSIARVSIQVGVVDTLRLATDSVSNAKILAGSIDTGKMAGWSIGKDNLIDGAVDSGKIAVNGVTKANIQAGVIDTTKMATDSVTAASILAGSINTSKLATTGVVAGTYGGSSNVPVLTVTADGRITSASNVSNSVATSSFVINVAITGSTTNTNFSTANIFSTATLTMGTGSGVVCSYSGGARNSGAAGNVCFLNIYVDGTLQAGFTTTAMGFSVNPGGNLDSNASFSQQLAGVASGQHNFGLVLAAGANTCTLSNTALFTNAFGCYEIK